MPSFKVRLISSSAAVFMPFFWSSLSGITLNIHLFNTVSGVLVANPTKIQSEV